MSQISLERRVSGQLADADLGVTLEDSAGAFGIRRNDTEAEVVPAGTAVSHDGLGLYSYDTSLLDPTIPYTAAWRVETTDWGVEYIYELILPPARGLCTLADIERETAKRIGPYQAAVVANNNSSKVFAVTKMISSLPIGGYEDKYVLRRGFMQDGTPIAGFLEDDRQRIIVTYTPDDGLLEVDRDYTNDPVEGEAIEIHYLDPENELRPIVLSALDGEVRFVDSATIRLRTALAEQNMSSYCPWITEKNQVWELSSAFSGSAFVPFLVNWWSDYVRDGNLWVTMAPVPYPNTVMIDHWRWASSMVNGSYSATGPTEDNDLLNVNVKYAAAKAHEQGFLMGSVRPRVMEAARRGLYISQDMAREEANKQADRYFKPGRRRNMVSAPGLDASLVVNGPSLQN